MLYVIPFFQVAKDVPQDYGMMDVLADHFISNSGPLLPNVYPKLILVTASPDFKAPHVGEQNYAPYSLMQGICIFAWQNKSRGDGATTCFES